MTAAIDYEPDETPRNPPWRLNEVDLEGILHAAEFYQRFAPGGGSKRVGAIAFKVAAMLTDLAEMGCRSREHAAPRDPLGLMDQAQVVDSGEAAQILGRPEWWVRRHQHKLGGWRDERGHHQFWRACVVAFEADHATGAK